MKTPAALYTILAAASLASMTLPSALAQPVAIPDAYATTENTTLTVAAPGLAANDFHPDGDAFLVSNFTQTSNGNVATVVTNGAFVYEPNPGFTGTDSFTYTLRETATSVFSEPATVTIEVLPDPNRAPLGIQDFYGTPQNTTLTVTAPGLSANDLDVDGDAFLVSNFTQTSNGNVATVVTSGAFVYEPNPGFTGTDSFTYTLRETETSVFSDPTTVTIFVGTGPPLPVELISFDGTADDTDVVLTWATASETNNSGFEVQHSVEGDFEAIGFVEGAGSTRSEQRYTYRVTGLEPGRHTFRLKQIDFDGAFEYTSVLEVVVEFPGSHHLSEAYPNPFTESTSMTLSVAQEQHVRIEVVDLLGRSVQVLYDGPLAANERKKLSFQANRLPSGLYVVHLTGEAFAASRMVTLAK